MYRHTSSFIFGLLFYLRDLIDIYTTQRTVNSEKGRSASIIESELQYHFIQCISAWQKRFNEHIQLEWSVKITLRQQHLFITFYVFRISGIRNMHCFVLATPVIKFPYYEFEREMQIAVLHVFPDRSHEVFINRCLYHFDLKYIKVH